MDNFRVLSFTLLIPLALLGGGLFFSEPVFIVGGLVLLYIAQIGANIEQQTIMMLRAEKRRIESKFELRKSSKELERAMHGLVDQAGKEQNNAD